MFNDTLSDLPILDTVRVGHELTPRTRAKLKGAHPEWRRIIIDVNNVLAIDVIDAYRNEERQNLAFARGASKHRYPGSVHNKLPSLAVDVIPLPLPKGWGDDDWLERVKFYEVAAVIKAIARRNGHDTRWGGDWDSDGDYHDNRFNDLVHHELILNGWKS